MRAKTVNESNNFERGRGTKASMELGGVIPRKKFDELAENFHDDVARAAIGYDSEWEDYLEETFVGKTITGIMVKLPTINTETGKMSGKRERGERTITVKAIRTSDSLSSIAPPSGSERPLSIIVADMENNMYELIPIEKIYFE